MCPHPQRAVRPEYAEQRTLRRGRRVDVILDGRQPDHPRRRGRSTFDLAQHRLPLDHMQPPFADRAVLFRSPLDDFLLAEAIRPFRETERRLSTGQRPDRRSHQRDAVPDAPDRGTRALTVQYVPDLQVAFVVSHGLVFTKHGLSCLGISHFRFFVFASRDTSPRVTVLRAAIRFRLPPGTTAACTPSPCLPPFGAVDPRETIASALPGPRRPGRFRARR